MASSQPLADMTGVCFRDQIFLNFCGGNLVASNVFDYFANSPFYDRSCTNEKLRIQGIHPLDTAELIKNSGNKSSLEYVLHHSQEPHLFVIKKQIRESADKATPVAVYYVLDGSVYQAPTLYGVIGSRMSRALHHIRKAFADCQQRMETKHEGSAPVNSKKKDDGNVKEQEELDIREVTRVDQILSSVFRKLPPAPLPPVPPQHTFKSETETLQDGNPGAAGEVDQGPTKKQRVTS